MNTETRSVSTTSIGRTSPESHESLGRVEVGEAQIVIAIAVLWENLQLVRAWGLKLKNEHRKTKFPECPPYGSLYVASDERSRDSELMTTWED